MDAGIISGFVGWAILLTLYFLPALFALKFGHRNANAIGVLNLFLGWTILGWVGALVWAMTKPPLPLPDRS